MSLPVGNNLPPPGKRKEIYKYDAPWPLYSMNWSVRPDKRFRLALGSFMEEYNNKVKAICCCIYLFLASCIADLLNFKQSKQTAGGRHLCSICDIMQLSCGND